MGSNKKGFGGEVFLEVSLREKKSRYGFKKKKESNL